MWAAFRALFAAIMTDRAAALLLFAAPLIYAGFYPSAYTGEVVVRAPVVVVDQDRSAASRDLVIRVGAAQQTELVASLPDIAAAESWMADGQAVAALIIPESFGGDIASGKTGTVVLIGHGAYLLRASSALTGIGVALGRTGREAAREQARAAGPPAPPALALQPRPLFNTREGYGAAVFPGVAFVIIHQSLLLGLALLAGTARERIGPDLRLTRRQLAGIALAASFIGLLDVGWFVGMVFWWHDYPRAAAPLLDVAIGAILFVAATVAAALALASIFPTRERPLQLVLPISLPLFFLAGLSWPAEATPTVLVALARLFPTTSGLELMVGLNQMGGSLKDYWHAALNLGLLTLLFGIFATRRWTSGLDVERGG
ncbi:ABC transporter permease [Erythrobacter sp.]|uniref:ABC transporter permease n=1 Tax=Erythrobacter sp. TaxID=1042 RepID=UPI0025E6C38E|nr:ABC transporter permease [Erythrobacter sp.]